MCHTDLFLLQLYAAIRVTMMTSLFFYKLWNASILFKIWYKCYVLVWWVYRVFQKNLYKVCQMINFEPVVLGLRRLYQNAQLTVFIGKVSLIVSLRAARWRPPRSQHSHCILKIPSNQSYYYLLVLSVCLYLCVFVLLIYYTAELCHWVEGNIVGVYVHVSAKSK